MLQWCILLCTYLLEVELDECLDGLGGRWVNVVYHIPLTGQCNNLAITQLEMLNILVALKLFVKHW